MIGIDSAESGGAVFGVELPRELLEAVRCFARTS
jgi:hypothetical protein